ncbi:hypothetical protein MTR_6g071830 [Medicago truncatula]|uniref:Uncharacterized protein n=1 Tax=Medicago truncatula TaxID=3880 RepID=G7KHV2_MEDTR|nr:hypothetical protein MTR_6g071830 [Medicago truncatula]
MGPRKLQSCATVLLLKNSKPCCCNGEKNNEENYPDRWSRPYGKAAIRRGGHINERKELSVRWSRPMERPPLGGKGYQRDGVSSRFTHLIIFTKIFKQLSRKLVVDSKFSRVTFVW